jgi:glucose-1-phosphate cytidylyltransferase
MKAVLLAGGAGSRLAEETQSRPKPMVEIGGKPLLWHIMKLYAAHGVREFVVCLGYKGYMIKEYFAHYLLHQSDVTFDLAGNRTQLDRSDAEPWLVTLVDTGETTLTGGRLKAARQHLGDEDFCMTYGDGVADVDITRLVAFHRQHQRLATVTAVRAPSRGANLVLEDRRVRKLSPDSTESASWINGGFFVLSPKVIDYVDGEQTSWEREPLERLAAEKQLCAFRHEGFWQPVDTLRDKQRLEELWASNHQPWRVWA